MFVEVGRQLEELVLAGPDQTDGEVAAGNARDEHSLATLQGVPVETYFIGQSVEMAPTQMHPAEADVSGDLKI